MPWSEPAGPGDALAMAYDVLGSDKEEHAEEVRQLHEDVDSDVVSGSEAEVVQSFDAEEDDDGIRQLYEEVDSDVVPGLDGECQADRSEELSDSSSDRASSMTTSSSFWHVKPPSGYWCFVHALFTSKFACALAVFKPEFAGMRMVPNALEEHRKHDATLSLPLHWLLSCTHYSALSPWQRTAWVRVTAAVPNTCLVWAAFFFM